MKKYFVLFLVIAVTFVNAADLKLGKSLTLKDKSPVSKILQNPGKFAGKTVLVEGKIVDVCQESGCWIEVAGDKAGQKIKVQFEEGKVSVPKDSKGKFVSVQGVVEEITAANSCGETEKDSKVSEKKDKKECESEGEEGGCCGGEKEAKAYQIKGLGAVIK